MTVISLRKTEIVTVCEEIWGAHPDPRITADGVPSLIGVVCGSVGVPKHEIKEIALVCESLGILRSLSVRRRVPAFAP
jgi:hypothetical protein